MRNSSDLPVTYRIHVLREVAGDYAGAMRDPDVIDSELRLLVAVRNAAREAGGPPPSIGPVDELLDERAQAQGE